jgi:hypothetical protein
MHKRELVAVVITADGRKVAMRLPSDSSPASIADRLRRRLRELLSR